MNHMLAVVLSALVLWLSSDALPAQVLMQDDFSQPLGGVWGAQGDAP
jgi:hypothetical protein